MHRIDFESLFDRLPSPHMVIDRDMVFVAVNPAYEQATMRSRGELLGRPLFEMFPNPGESGQRLRASIEHAFTTGESDTLAYLPYSIPRSAEAGGGMEERFWTAVHTPLTANDGETLFVVQNTVDVTEFVQMREARSLPLRSAWAQPPIDMETGLQLIERAREAESAQRNAVAESNEFRQLFQQAPQMMAVLSGAEHAFTFANDAFRRFTGNRDLIGKSVRSAVPELDGQGFFELLDEVYGHGREHGGEGVRVMLLQDGSGPPREAFMDFTYRPIRDAEGAISGVFVQGVDRTSSVRAAKRQRLLLDELNHRVKNTLATVQSIAAQTLRSAPDLHSARRDFENRIIALSRAHNLLSARAWVSIDLSAVAEQQFAAYEAGRISVEGPKVVLNSKATIAVAMLFHELADNAIKHGALSTPEGGVSVGWRLEQDGEGERLTIEWNESGGPLVATPSRKGFGARMLERVALGELGGRLTVDYAPEGFFCQIGIPASSYARMEDAPAVH